MKIAVVVPFSSEPAEWLQVCFNSVFAQRTPAQIIAVGDGAKLSEKKMIDAVPLYKLIELPVAHGDGGSAARCIGAIEAITSGFDAVAFLDGDNWYAPGHLSEMVALHNETGAPLCTGTLSIMRIDGSAWDGLRGESDGDKHADTNTIFINARGFPAAAELGAGAARARLHLRSRLVAAGQGERLRAGPPEARNRVLPEPVRAAVPASSASRFRSAARNLRRRRAGTYSVKVPAMEMDCEISPRGVWKWQRNTGQELK
jgi:glycosyltransferase involved in cell wall biosynthesis